MAASTFTFFALAVAASALEAEFDIGKFEIGLLGAVNTLVGGLTAPMAGRISDRIGGRFAMGATLVAAGLSAALAALSNSYLTLLAVMGLAGIAQGSSNPACNRAISEGITKTKRGIVTGIKQSGVQLAVFITGFAVPGLTEAFGWRSSMWFVAGFAAIALLGLPLIQASDVADTTKSANAAPARLSMFVNQVAIYGFLLGIVGGGLGRFLPLFAEEEVGLTLAQAGQVFGVQGLVAIPTRLVSGVLLDRGVSARAMLGLMGLIGAVAVVLILAASGGGAGFLWAGTVLAGMTLGSWNTAANLSMIRQPDAGRATGRLILGFLIGLTVGGPVVGWSIDNFGYSPAWIASAILALAGAAVVARRVGDEQPSITLSQ